MNITSGKRHITTKDRPQLYDDSIVVRILERLDRTRLTLNYGTSYVPFHHLIPSN